MAKLLCLRSCAVRHGNAGFGHNISRNTNTLIPATEPISEDSVKSLNPEIGKLRNLRFAVTPSYGKGIDIYADMQSPTYSTNSTLAGNPRRLTAVQNIREEILEKWNRRPTTDIRKEWLRYIVFN